MASAYGEAEPDSDDRSLNPTGLGNGPTGSPGVPCSSGNDFPKPDGTSTNAEPTATPPAGSSTNAQPRPEDFMGGGGY